VIFMKIRLSSLFWAVLILGWTCAQTSAQTIRLYQAGTTTNRITVQVGQQVDIEVFANLSGVEASGLAFYITVPDEAFQVIDQRPPPNGPPGVQPFTLGPLFHGAGEQINALIPETEPAAASFPGQQLEYGIVVAGVGSRVRMGSGVVATFSLLCVKPVEYIQATIDDSPVRETRLVLADGISERRFRTVSGIEIHVIGIELRDIPDVIMLPGQADSTTIGSLNNYIQNLTSTISVDSVRWSFQPTAFDSLTVEVDPVTKQVKITPAPGWTGRRRITWIATEPVNPLEPDQPPLSASEISDIVVNNPPYFAVAPDPDGVKRDTVRFAEDQHPFVPGSTGGDPLQGFRGQDLDALVVDVDVLDPQEELHFLVLPFAGVGDTVKIRGQVDPTTHELLVWSRPEFAGTDSLRVIVTDLFRSQDTLRVIVEVEAVNDRPEFKAFILENRKLEIRTGGTRTYPLEKIVEDVDTPLDSLLFSWNPPGDHFTIDTVRTGDEGLKIVIGSERDFLGDGFLIFRVADPADPENLLDTMTLNVTVVETSRPEILLSPPEMKIDLTAGGDPVVYSLDDFVEDPDNEPEDLAWDIVTPGFQSTLDIDANRQLSTAAPLEFVGYEEVRLTVTDPDTQADTLTLRLYSSDGRPVVGGLPDLVMDPGEIRENEFDLDNFSYDSNDSGEGILWRVLDTFDSNYLQVFIDPITHYVTFRVSDRAKSKTEDVVFRATDSEGTSGVDSMKVRIGLGGVVEPGGFTILPLPTDLEVQADHIVEFFDLDDYIQVPADIPKESIRWSVTVLAGDHSTPKVGDGNVVSILGRGAGIDTLEFTAQDSLDRVQTATMTVRVFGKGKKVDLLPIPDVQFVVNHRFISQNLNSYIVNREAHPDSVVQWSVESFGPQGDIFAWISDDTTLSVTAGDTSEAQIILVVRNLEKEDVAAGRDTIRVIAHSTPTCGLDFPPVVFFFGAEDSSITLNEYLPDQFRPEDGTDPEVRWTVSGQHITLPVIDPEPPHVLRLSGVGQRIGLDTLTLAAEITGGFRCEGPIEVAVEERPDSVLVLQVVPHPLNPLFIDVFVLAWKELAGPPNVFRSYEASDSTVAMSQIEDDLEGRGALIWTGNVRLRPGATGTVRFRAQAFTRLGTDVKDTTSVSIAAAVAGKPVVVEHGGAKLTLPADAVAPDTPVLLQTVDPDPPNRTAKPADSAELELRTHVYIYPAGMALTQPGSLHLAGFPAPLDGLYERKDGRWVFIGPAEQPARIARLGHYAVLRDPVPPGLCVLSSPASGQAELTVAVEDGGSGVEAAGIRLRLNGEAVAGYFREGYFRWSVPGSLAGEGHALELSVRDRAGNETVHRIEFSTADLLPQRTELWANFPNPFNPATTIPFSISSGLGNRAGGTEVRLVVFNVSGQLVRRLLDQTMTPGHYQVQWDGRNAAGEPVGSGVYIYRLETPNAALTRRMTLLK